MFWGLIMEPNKRYSQVVKKDFHISMASLDINSTDDKPAQVLCGYEGKNYLLCTLQAPNKLQCNLDLYFEEGKQIAFATNGKGLVHLTGYLSKEDEFGLEGESEEESDEELEVQTKKKRKEKDAASDGLASKKIKLDYLFKDINEEEESDDSDFNIDKVMAESDEDSSEDEAVDAESEDIEEEEESGEEEEDAEEEEDSDEEGEEASEEEVEEEECEEEEDDDEKPTEKLQNGLSKKSKKNKLEEEPSTPTKKNKQTKEKPHQLTPGPKAKKDKSNTENGTEKKVEGKKDKKNEQKTESPAQKKRTLSHGIIVEDLRIGNGEVAKNGKFIHVYYEGRLKNNNKVFDKTLNGPGFGFRLGKGEVIQGWDIGVNGMKVGGKRRIICPPQVAYGPKGSPPAIPPNATLVFDVEIKKVK